MVKTLHGKVHGRTIELDQDLGVPDGQAVVVQVRTLPAPSRQPGDGLLRTEGALAGDPEWDALMEEIRQSRKSDQRHRTADLGDA